MNISFIKSKIDYKYNLYKVRYARSRYSHSDINSNRYSQKPLTKAQRNEITESWNGYHRLGKDSWKWFQFYNSITDCPEKLSKYIPEGIYYSLIDPFYSNVQDCDAIDDKNLYDLLFHDVMQPKTICRKQGGMLMNSDFEIISFEDVKKIMLEAGEVIIKPSRDSNSGMGITFIKADDCNDEEIKSALSGDSLVVQEVFQQHKILNDIHPQSLNTIRIITMMRDGKVYPLSSVIRIGTGSARVDNAHSGGIVCGIDKNGYLKNRALNLIGEIFESNPTDGRQFNTIQIPSYDACRDLVCKLAPRLGEYTKLASWDLSVSEAGEPVLIEVNLTYGGVDVHQLCNGPIFGDLTDEILNEVFNKIK